MRRTSEPIASAGKCQGAGRLKEGGMKTTHPHPSSHTYSWVRHTIKYCGTEWVQWQCCVSLKITRVPHCDRKEAYQAGYLLDGKVLRDELSQQRGPSLNFSPWVLHVQSRLTTSCPSGCPRTIPYLCLWTLRLDSVIPSLVETWTKSATLPLLR